MEGRYNLSGWKIASTCALSSQLRANENEARKLLIPKDEGSQRGKFMKQLKRDLKAISKSLKQLTLGTEKIFKAVEKLEKDQVKSKSVKKPANPKKAVK